jgi:hypothetical protein
MECHPPVLVIAAEHSGKAFSERNYRRIENAVGVRKKVTWDYRIGGISPYGVFASFGSFLPGNVGERFPYDREII